MAISLKDNEGGVISITTIDRGRVVGAFTCFSRSVCVCVCVCGIQQGGSLVHN